MTKPIITYEQFSALDIRIGEIKSVAVVDGADRLLCLSVDVGDTDVDGQPRLRQIVSGIREFFPEPQVLVGQRCPFLINLEPRIIKGVESQGMILAGQSDDGLALLKPHRELPAGTAIL